MTGASPNAGFPGSAGYAGPEWFFTGSGSEFNAISFLVDQAIAGRAFSGLVKVIAVHGGGPGSGPATVDVQPMVSQVDGFGNQTPHGIVYGLPCFRVQSGAAALVVDPIAGDVGQAIICDRDTSTVRATKAVGGPGSSREHSWPDGCYFGSFLGGTPSVYVAIAASGVTITDGAGGTVTISGGVVTVTGAKVIMPNLPSTLPTTKWQLWYDPTDGNRVKSVGP
jgi:hypothetical protein